MLVMVLLFSALSVALYVRAYGPLSPVDELQHVDSMIKASHGEVVRRGDHVGQAAMREEACRGVDGAALPLPACDSAHFEPADFQEEGYNTAEIHPPTYYAITGLLARAMLPLLGGRGIVTAARLVGALWLMAGVAVLWYLLAAFAVRVSSRAVVLLLLVTSPAVLHTSSTVTNDVTALVAGGGLLLAAVSWQRRRLPGWVVVAIAVAGVLLKLTNLTGAAVVVGYLLLQALHRRGVPAQDTALVPDRRAHLLMAAGITAGVAAGGLAWVVLHNVLATAPNLSNPISRKLQVDSLSLGQLLPSMGAGVVPVDGAHLAPFLGSVVVTTVMMMLRWLFIGSSFGLAASAEPGSREEAMAVSATVTMVAAGPFFVLVNFLTLSVFYAVPSRYMLSVMPAVVVAFALFLRKPWLNAAGGALAAIAVVATLAALI